MKCELPELGRCCFCFPLRIGLLVWGYIKLIINFILLCFMIDAIKDSYELLLFSEYTRYSYFVIYIIITVLVCLDIIFHLIFAVSGHKKDSVKMKWFCKFSIFVFFIYTLAFLLSIVFMTSFHPSDGFGSAIQLFIGFTASVVCFCCIVSQIYVIILIRTEVRKLQRSSNLEFVNQTADEIVVKVDLSNPAA